MSWTSVAILLCLGVLVGCSAGQVASGADGVSLDAKALYGGFEAAKVLLDKDGKKLALDARVFKFCKEQTGVVTTDAIDLGPSDGIIGAAADVRSVEVEVAADAPEGATVTVEVRSGATAFDQTDWSAWKKLAGLKGTVEGLSGRYVQVRMTLSATKEDKVPALTGLTLRPAVVTPPGAAWPALKVVDAKIQTIVRSPINFQYERPDNPKIVAFRKDAKLDEVVAGAKDDFEKRSR